MNKVLIVDASESDRRLMAGVLVKSGYEPIAVGTLGSRCCGIEIPWWHCQRVS